MSVTGSGVGSGSGLLQLAAIKTAAKQMVKNRFSITFLLTFKGSNYFFSVLELFDIFAVPMR
jgi:hypothetical protein